MSPSSQGFSHHEEGEPLALSPRLVHASLASPRRPRNQQHHHRHAYRTSCKCVTLGLIGLCLVAASLRTLSDEFSVTRSLYASWQEVSPLAVETTAVPNPLLVPDGVLLPLQKPATTVSSLGRQVWFKSLYDRDVVFVTGGQGTPNHTFSKAFFPRVKVLGMDSAGAWVPTTNKPRTVYPIVSPPSTWLAGDVTRGYPFLEDSNDEEVHMERRAWPEDEVDPKCQPMQAWQSWQFPVCNTVHEHDLQEGLVQAETSLVSLKGFWRHVWRRDIAHNQTIVWKTFKLEHNMEDAFFENNRVDALAMERLTASPHIINAYAFCAMTVSQEFAGKEISALPKSLTSMDKLRYAAKVAKAVSDIHSIDGPEQPPSLVHNDINLANLVLTEDNRPVLNDFNIAILLKKHNETGEICPFPFRFPNPQWRSPEEQIYLEDRDNAEPPLVTEKVDVYALGNVLYRLLVGRSPWKPPEQTKLYPEQKEQVAHLKHENGTLPFIPPEIRNNTDFATRIMREALYKCYRFNPQARPSAREILAFLVNAISQKNNTAHSGR